MKHIYLALLLTLSAVSGLDARDLKLASIFSDNMVLQRDCDARIWGTAESGSTVHIKASWGGKTCSVKADSEGRWSATLSTPGDGGPYTVSVSCGKDRTVLRDVYCGEVWIASGQSNMSMPLRGYYGQPVLGSTGEILSSGGTQIHFVNIPTVPSRTKQDGFEGACWQKASPENAGECTAVGWFFARSLQSMLGVHVGIINASFSGSNVEAWMPEEACREFFDISVPDPADTRDMSGGNIATTLYNGMLNPVAGFSARGFIWYQGESDVFNVPRFAPATAAMVRHWRGAWGDGKMPFYFVQIAPYDYTEWNFYTPQWPEISAWQRDAQRRCLQLIPDSGMAVTLDIGEKNCIHPSHKREVGERLALIALARDYGMSGFDSESPEFDRMEVKDGKAVLHFRNCPMGLTTFGRELTLFEVSGWNRVFVPAEAYIDSDGTVVVSSRLVDTPEAVRYAYRDYVEAELFSTGGLPVGTFRTDDWE